MTRRNLSLDLLKGFEAAARHLSFTRAGQELFLTQSAISREVKRLEEQLGVELFSRTKRGLSLTDAGRLLYSAVSEALRLVKEATDHLTASTGAQMLTVTTSAPFASLWLVPKLPKFFRLHPDVDVRTVAADESLDIEREGIDVAIRFAPEGSSISGGDFLLPVRRFPVCAPSLARDSSRPLRAPADLARHVLLDLDTATGRGRWSDWAPWLQAMHLEKLRPKGSLRFSHYDQVVQAAIEGSGVAIGRTPHNIRHLREGLLIAPFGRESEKPWGAYFVLVAKQSAERTVVKEFKQWLRDEVHQDGATGAAASMPAKRIRASRKK